MRSDIFGSPIPIPMLIFFLVGIKTHLHPIIREIIYVKSTFWIPEIRKTQYFIKLTICKIHNTLHVLFQVEYQK